jgi:hypothetical protein
MSIDRGASNRKTALEDIADNYTSCANASMRNKEDGHASDSSQRCVVGISANDKKTSLPVLLVGSDEDSKHNYLQVRDSIMVGKIGNNYSEQTESGSSTNENRPIFSITFRNRDIARLVSIGCELD